jgi:predicted dehydrogenase
MIAVIGMGFMGRTHAAAYERARELGYSSSVRGVYTLAGDIARIGNLRLRGVAPATWPVYPSLEALLADREVVAVSICTPTDTHVELATRALDAGKHVLVEKPVALDVDSIRALEAAARRADRIVMPAFCMRFWPGWPWLRDRIASGELGALRALSFTRTAAPPDWNDFYLDPARSGDALFDLHLHDADFIRWCLGNPRQVMSAGTERHLSTVYYYDGLRGPIVAEGGWLNQPGLAFRMRYVADFEDGVADFELGRSPELQVTRGGLSTGVKLASATAYELEVRHFLDLVLGRSAPLATLGDAIAVTQLLEAERSSFTSQRPVPFGVAGGLSAR